MADSFVRRLRILEMLKRKDDGAVSIPQIIHKLKVMGYSDILNKTIERDMTYLSGQFNIGCNDTVRPFQWWWAGNNSIDIPGMGRNSALTFHLSQQYLEPLLPKASLKHLKPKFKKAKKVLSGKAQKKDRNWIKKIKVVPKILEQIPAKVSSLVQQSVYDALYDEKMLEITYHSRMKDEITKRRIHPLALIYRGITTELIFCDEGSSTPKRFILNRIQKAILQVQSVIIPEDFELNHFIQHNLGFPGSCKEIQFKAWISDYSRPEVEETPLSKFQKIEEAEGGGIILTATLRDTIDLTTWILGLGSKIIVMEPKFLRDSISKNAQEMCDNYQQAD